MSRAAAGAGPFNVCLLGASLTTGNMGVSALAASLIGLVRKVRPDARISLFTGERSASPQELNLPGHRMHVDVINFRLSPRAPVKEHLFWLLAMACIWRVAPSEAVRGFIARTNPRIRALLESDFAGDIRGGDSFSDIYGLRRFLIGSIPDIILIMLKKRLVLLPQTYGPYNSSVARRVARLIMAGSACILSRDLESMDTVKRTLGAGARERNVLFCPDVAFTMEPALPPDPDIRPPMPKGDFTPVVGFNISGLMYNGGYTRSNMFGLGFDYKAFVHELVKRLLDQTDARLLLVPHTYAQKGSVESDPDACLEVLATVPERHMGRVHMLMRECDQHEVKGVIGLCDFFVGSRMHACIAALSQGIPTVGVAYSKKFKGVFESVGEGRGVVDARQGDMESAVEAVLTRYRERQGEGNAAREKMRSVKEAIGARFRESLGDAA